MPKDPAINLGNGDKEREWEGARTLEQGEGEASYRCLTR